MTLTPPPPYSVCVMGITGSLRELADRLRRPGLGAEARLRCLQAVAVAVPLVVAPLLLDSAVELPKRLLLVGLVGAGWAVLLGEAVERGGFGRPLGPLAPPILALIASAFVSCLVAPNTGMALEEAWLILAYAGLAFLAGATAGPQGRAAESRLVTAFLVAAGVEGLYGVLQYAGVDFLPWSSSWGSRCFGTIGNPVYFAEFLEPLFVLTAAVWMTEKDEERRDLMALMAVIVFVALVFAQTRSAWIGSAAGLAAAGWLAWRYVSGGRDLLSRNRSWLLSFGGLGIAMALTVSSPTLFGKSALPLRDRVKDAVNLKGWTVRHRLVLWRAAALMTRDNPIVGVGADSFHSRFPLVQATFRDEYAKKGFLFPPKEPRVHNDYFQLAAEQGLVGLGLWLWFVVALVRMAVMAARRAETAEAGMLVAGMAGGCVSLLVDACFNFPFRIIPAAAVFWAFTGLIAARAFAKSAAPEKEPEASLRPAAKVALGTAVVVWFAWMVVPAWQADRAKSSGDFYYGANMWEMADLFYGKSLKARPFDTLIRYQRGLALEKSSAFDWTGKTWDRALVEFKAALAMGQNDELLYAHLALLSEKKGDIARAANYGSIAASIDPQYLDNTSNLSFWLATREQRMGEALAFAKGAVDGVPEHPIYRWIYGLVLEKAGRNREALAMMKSALPLMGRVSNGLMYVPDLTKDIARVKKATKK